MKILAKMGDFRVCLYANASKSVKRESMMIRDRKVRTAGQMQEQGSPDDWGEWDAGHEG